MLSNEDYIDRDATALAELVRSGQASPSELIEIAIARIEAHNPKLNAVIHKLYDRAHAAAKRPLSGPFGGVPFLIKDLSPSSLAGSPQCNGSRSMRSFVAKHDSELVRRWQAAGLIPLGKTNTPEFGLTPFTEPAAFGPARNPYDTARTTGGSSGGSAAAVAARMVPLAGAGDGGGSIRIPASACGLFGLKPTRARNPIGPLLVEGWGGFVVEHVVTRSVRDSAALLDATHGPDAGMPTFLPAPVDSFLAASQRAPGKLRIAFTTNTLIGSAATIHPDCIDALNKTVALLQSLGHEVFEATPPVDPEPLAIGFVTVLTAGLAEDIAETARLHGGRPRPHDYEVESFALAKIGRAISAHEYSVQLMGLKQQARRVLAWWQTENIDLLLTPTLAQPPVLHGSLRPSASELTQLKLLGRTPLGKFLPIMKVIEPLALKIFGFIPHTPLFNVTGQPGMSVPLYTNAAGLPIGMQFIGRYGDEATLLSLAGQLEQAVPWAGRMPDNCRS